MKQDSIPSDVMYKVEAELLEGEDLLWVGQPNPMSAMIGPHFLRDLTPLVMIGIFMLFFFSVAAIPFSEMPGPGFIFYLIPLFMVSTTVWPFLSRYFTATRSTYALTSRRALILEGNNVKSYGPDDVEFIQRNMRGEDSGDLLFANKISTYRSNNRTRIKTTPIGFLGIDNVRRVEAIMLETFRDDDPRKEKSKRDFQDDNDPFYDDGEVAYFEQSS